MTTNILIPHKFKNIGWLLLILGVILGVYLTFNDFESDYLKVPVFTIYNSDSLFKNYDGLFKILEPNSLVNEIAALLIIIGGFLVGFSREIIEDEYIAKIRLESLLWAIITNYVVLSLGIIFIFEFTFFNVLVFNMFTPLLFFILRFHYLKFKMNRDEK